jgi:type I restriction enzyme R subunit
MPPLPRLNPEAEARVRIDEMLVRAGWLVVDYADADFAAGPGVAVREFMTPNGPMDYLLVADRKVVGSIEAKKQGDTLRQVEVQADRYADGFEALVAKRDLPRYDDRLPFHYISTGTETLFTSRRDPIRRPREVFSFHTPETLAAWGAEPTPYGARLRQLPSLNAEGLRDVQAEAIRNLEASLADDHPRALAAITMGGGKTRFAVAETYRLLTFGKASRILFLVDRVSLGDQAQTEFLKYVSPDDGRRFGDLYGVQVLRSSTVEKAANVIICPSSASTRCCAATPSSTTPISTRFPASRPSAPTRGPSRSPTTGTIPSSFSTSSGLTSATAPSTAAGGRCSTTSTPPSSA